MRTDFGIDTQVNVGLAGMRNDGFLNGVGNVCGNMGNREREFQADMQAV